MTKTTTHNVEARLKRPISEGIGDHGQWFPINRTPMSKRDAEDLMSMLGPHWEGRIVALESALGQDFAELERLFSRPIKRWEMANVAHHPDCRRDAADEQWNTHVFGADASDVLKGEEWVSLRDIRVAASYVVDEPEEAIVKDPIVHTGRCLSCGAIRRALSVKVTIVKTDHTSVTREYAIP